MTTPILGLDELEDSQSQPHVPLNAGTRALEQWAQLIVLDKDLSTPPGSPAEGDAYIVAAGGSDEWDTWDGSIAYYSGGWLRLPPRVGLLAYVTDEDAYYQYNGDTSAGWAPWTPTVSAQPYDMGAQMTGVPSASLVLLRYKFPRSVTFPAGLTNAQGTAGTAATVQTDFDIKKNGSSVGTMRFAAAGTSATFIMASQQVFSAGDIMTVVAPASPDATLADVSFVLAGTR
jgi:hypothetical protein